MFAFNEKYQERRTHFVFCLAKSITVDVIGKSGGDTHVDQQVIEPFRIR